MRVLHLVNGVRILGAERVAIELVQQLPENQYESYIGLTNGGKSLETEIKNSFTKSTTRIVDFSGQGRFGIFLALLRFCRRTRIELIHSHGYKSNFLAILLRFFVPGLRLVSTNHNYIVSTRREKLYRWLDLKVLHGFHRLVTVSDIALREMVRGGLPMRKIRVVNNGIDVHFSSPGKGLPEGEPMFGVPPNFLLVGVVASLTNEKAHKDLLSALSLVRKEFADFCLLILGDGPLRDDLEKQVKVLELTKNVQFLGHRNDVRQILPNLDIFVLPSHREGLPMALLEAMAAGVAVIASRVGAIPRVVEDMHQGMLFDPGQVRQLADCLGRLMADSQLRCRLAENGCERVKSEFSSERMAQEYMEEYVNALETL